MAIEQLAVISMDVVDNGRRVRVRPLGADKVPLGPVLVIVRVAPEVVLLQLLEAFRQRARCRPHSLMYQVCPEILAPTGLSTGLSTG